MIQQCQDEVRLLCNDCHECQFVINTPQNEKEESIEIYPEFIIICIKCYAKREFKIRDMVLKIDKEFKRKTRIF